jgi:hypothetical protein
VNFMIREFRTEAAGETQNEQTGQGMGARDYMSSAVACYSAGHRFSTAGGEHLSLKGCFELFEERS